MEGVARIVCKCLSRNIDPKTDGLLWDEAGTSLVDVLYLCNANLMQLVSN